MLTLAVALLPVVTFLVILVLMDSFKLASPRAVAAGVAYGAVAALACLGMQFGLSQAGVGRVALQQGLGPLVEETAKALYLVYLVRQRRVAFPVDAAVQGFAIGAGFALVENIEYFRALGGGNVGLWVVRGFGTAMLHGATTAIVGMLAREVADRDPDRLMRAFVPAISVAVVVHAAFNAMWLPAVWSTVLILTLLPVLVAHVFQRSERATREWIGAGLDLDVELLELVRSEFFADTHFGNYLRQLRTTLPGPVVADMLCLLRLELELSVQAKAMLMAREAGLAIPVDDDLHASLAELEYLRRSIGPSGLLALKPLQVTSHRDDWHRYLLREAAAARALGSGSEGGAGGQISIF